MNDLKTDKRYMQRALRLAARARGRTNPNPMVGAVIVKDGVIIAEDYHRKAGELHAEALALKHAGDAARGADLYVTLEPCCHTDKRTPPCTQAILASGIRRVVVAMEDPNPKVAGKGISELKNKGVDVIVGVCETEARVLNESYCTYIVEHRPFVILKSAMTLDGKIATPDGQSKWITGEKARRVVHEMRSSVDALVSAIGTVKADNPQFTSRIRGGRNPKRIIIDPNLETPMTHHVLTTPPETILVVSESVRKRYADKTGLLTMRGVEVLSYDGDRLDLAWLMRLLAARGITSVLIEGGASLNASALQAGIVDKVAIFVAPKMIGGRESLTPVGGDGFRSLDNPYRIERLHVRHIDEDLLIEGYVSREA